MKLNDNLKDIGITEPDEFLWDPEGFGFEWVTEEKIDDQSRWSTYFSRVAKKLSEDKYYEFSWASGSTEYQETDLDLMYQEVIPKEVTQTIYVSVS